MTFSIKKNQSITFIGMPGAGKSYISNILSNHFNLPLTDLDSNIEKKYNLPLPQIIDKYGEKKFKEIEKQSILDIDFSTKSIISTGGSVIYCQDGMDYLKNDNNIIIFLLADFDLLKNRTENFTNRGIVFNNLTPLQLFHERNVLYSKYSDYSFDFNNKDYEYICNFFHMLSNN